MEPDFDCDDLPVAKTWSEWGKVFTDVDIWEPAVREIARRIGLRVRTIDAGDPGSNAVFIVNRQMPGACVVKIYAPLCPEDYILERVLHPLLDRWPEIGAPALLGEGTLGENGAWPFVVLTFVSGEPIRDVREDMPDRDLLATARDLGHRLRVLHRIPVPLLTELDTTAEGWHRTADRHLAQTVEKLRNRKVLPRTVTEAIPGFVRSVLQSPEEHDLMLVSGDVTEDHVLLEERDGRWAISGLIDFADALVAPRTYEWIAVWFSALGGDSACLQALLEGYGGGIVADADFYRRAMAYTFLHEFGAEIITDELRRLGSPAISSIQALQAVLWEPD